MQNIFAGTTNFNKKYVKLSLEPKAAYNPKEEGGGREKERESEREG